MINLLIIADDLTGAIETGAQLSKKGVPTLVTYDTAIDIQKLPDNIKVLVIDTESRYIPAKDAAQRIIDVIEKAKSAGIKTIYEKTDSLLRGNIGVEFEALLTGMESNLISYIPAYPKAKRYTKKGYQYVEDALLENSIYASDPSDPVKCSYIPEIIKKQTKIKTRVIPVRYIGNEKLIKQKNKRILIFDCESNSDLRNIGQYLLEHNALHLVAGTAGFAELLPGLLQLSGGAMLFSSNEKPVLLINGSLNKISLEQAEFARVNGFKQVFIPPDVIYNATIEKLDAFHSVISAIIKLAEKGENTIIQSVKTRAQLNNYMQQGGVDTSYDEKLNNLVAKNIGYMAKLLLESGKFGNMVIFGSSTTLAVFKAIGISSIYPKTEILPGLCYANVFDEYNKVPIITKSGGFGEVDIMMKITSFLRSKR